MLKPTFLQLMGRDIFCLGGGDSCTCKMPSRLGALNTKIQCGMVVGLDSAVVVLMRMMSSRDVVATINAVVRMGGKGIVVVRWDAAKGYCNGTGFCI